MTNTPDSGAPQSPKISKKTAIGFLIAAAVAVLIGFLAMYVLPLPSAQPESVSDTRAQSEPPPIQVREMQKLTIGDRVFQVVLADTPWLKQQGLMHIRSLPEDNAMLFEFDPPQVVSFWMKNTYIPLDMIFIDQAGKIIGIHPNAQPHSLETIESPAPVRAVLEINGGLSEKWGIKVGDVVNHPIFE